VSIQTGFTNASQEVLLCNAGSTTLKLQRRHLGSEELSSSQFTGSPEQLHEALTLAITKFAAPLAVIHRIVHAGPVPEEPRLLDAALLEQIAHWSVLAPLHNPLTLSLIDIVRKRWPQVPQYGVFDSGLYAQLPDYAAHYALPTNLSPRWPLRRYGFHGLAHRNQWRQVRLAAERAGRPAPRRLISLHLGGGCSLTAWRDDCVMDTSMGFTPMEGLMMATRSGSIDPGILLHLLQQEDLSVAELSALLRTQSGLATLAGEGGDIRVLLRANTTESNALLAMYCYQIRKAIGGAVAALGGLDAISIGGGVGEHQSQIREWVFGDLAVFGVELDVEKNREAHTFTELHGIASRVALCLTPVNEFDEMFRQCRTLLEVAMEFEA
jgi:acetate kinase